MSEHDIERIAPSELTPSETHVRGTHDPPGEQLVQSISNIGIINPPIGRREDGKVRLIDGVRRTRAAEQAGVETIPVVVRGLDDAEARCQSLTLNDSEAGVRKAVHDADRDQSLDRLADLSGERRESAEKEIGLLSDADLIERELAHVPGVGRATVERIADHYSHEELVEPPDGYGDGVWETPTTPLTSIEGIGEQTARAIRRELYDGETAGLSSTDTGQSGGRRD